MAKKRKLAFDSEQIKKLNAIWNTKTKTVVQVLTALFQQNHWNHVRGRDESKAYHAAVVELLRAYFDKRPEKELNLLIEKAEESFSNWFSVYIHAFTDNSDEKELSLDLKRFIFFQSLIMQRVYEIFVGGKGAFDMDNVSVDEDGIVHGKQAEEILQEFEEKWQGFLKEYESDDEEEYESDEEDDDDDEEEDDEEEYESDEEDDDDDDDDGDDEEWDDYGGSFVSDTYDWPMGDRVLFLYMAYVMAIPLVDGEMYVEEADSYLQEAQKAIRTYMKPASARQRELALERATALLEDLYEVTRDYYDDETADSSDYRYIFYEVLFDVYIDVDEMFDDEVKRLLRSFSYDKSSKEYHSDAMCNRVIALVQEAVEIIHKGNEEASVAFFDVDCSNADEVIDAVLDCGDLSKLGSQPNSTIPAYNPRTLSNDPQHYYANKMVAFWKKVNALQDEISRDDVVAILRNMQDWIWYAIRAHEEGEVECAVEILLSLVTRYSSGLVSNKILVDEAKACKISDDNYMALMALGLQGGLSVLIRYLDYMDFDCVLRVWEKLRTLFFKLKKADEKVINLQDFWEYYDKRVNGDYERRSLWD